MLCLWDKQQLASNPHKEDCWIQLIWQTLDNLLEFSFINQWQRGKKHHNSFFFFSFIFCFFFCFKIPTQPRKKRGNTEGCYAKDTTTSIIHRQHQATKTSQPIAYFWVQLRALASYLARSVLYMCAISGTRGSSGFGSVSNEHMESSTCFMNTIYV